MLLVSFNPALLKVTASKWKRSRVSRVSSGCVNGGSPSFKDPAGADLIPPLDRMEMRSQGSGRSVAIIILLVTSAALRSGALAFRGDCRERKDACLITSLEQFNIFTVTLPGRWEWEHLLAAPTWAGGDLKDVSRGHRAEVACVIPACPTAVLVQSPALSLRDSDQWAPSPSTDGLHTQWFISQLEHRHSPEWTCTCLYVCVFRWLLQLSHPGD